MDESNDTSDTDQLLTVIQGITIFYSGQRTT
jgi:hypothetical protein